jgi:activator of Hsp90 ATPase-like protein
VGREFPNRGPGGGRGLHPLPQRGHTAKGRIVEIEPPRRIVFTYLSGGVDSLVTVHLEETEAGTRLDLRHAFSSAKIRDQYVQGWRFQLNLLSKAVADDSQADVTRHIETFFKAWSEKDPGIRRALLESRATPAISFRDAYSATDGIDDLVANLAAVQAFLPGVTLSRAGDVRLSHGTALVGWNARRENGESAGGGVNVFELAPDGRIARVSGFWDR